MKVAIFGTKKYDREFITDANKAFGHDIKFFKSDLDITTCALAEGYPAVCAFVNDDLGADVLERLAEGGTSLIAMRCAGYNNVDIKAAQRLGLTVSRVPAYSPYAVAEHAIGLMLALNRKIYRAYTRVRDGNFSLEGLIGFDLHDKVVGIIGTGRIGQVVAQTLSGFNCRMLGYDKYPDDQCRALGIEYVELEKLYQNSDIITLHCPLTPETYHLIDWEQMMQMKDGVMLINTSRGALLNARAAIAALKLGKIGYLGLDVYEEESELFFEDQSDVVIQDDVFARLLTFPNVIVTGHQAFLTREALTNIAEVTLENVRQFEQTGKPKYLVEC